MLYIIPHGRLKQRPSSLQRGRAYLVGVQTGHAGAGATPNRRSVPSCNSQRVRPLQTGAPLYDDGIPNWQRRNLRDTGMRVRAWARRVESDKSCAANQDSAVLARELDNETTPTLRAAASHVTGAVRQTPATPPPGTRPSPRTPPGKPAHEKDTLGGGMGQDRSADREAAWQDRFGPVGRFSARASHQSQVRTGHPVARLLPNHTGD